jgi:hypothetical protein
MRRNNDVDVQLERGKRKGASGKRACVKQLRFISRCTHKHTPRAAASAAANRAMEVT